MRQEKTELTNFCMVFDEEKNKVLVLNKRDDSYVKGITFVGGHIDAGESFADAVVREVYEETGLIISDVSLKGVADWIGQDGLRYIAFLYKTTNFEGEIIHSKEGEVYWMDFDEFVECEKAIGVEEMFKVIMSDEFSEFYSVEKEKKRHNSIK